MGMWRVKRCSYCNKDRAGIQHVFNGKSLETVDGGKFLA